ncbi:protein ADM2a [Paramisgurnus dabryanus]|uniref:protein ADM2a n=1 Tax=Paramisgurnus dabryanus TaxID=90735 RepID=UPI0031F36D3B
MRSLFTVTVYCISLLSSHLLAVPVKTPLEMNRLNFMARPHQQTVEVTISPDVKETDRGVSIDHSILWKAILSRPPPSALSNPSEIHVSQPIEGESNKGGEAPHQRGRRHVYSRNHHNHHHGQLMRVGCILGTCQVQNLSHRLYQLAGQTRREDSSPINPRSPHSYG